MNKGAKGFRRRRVGALASIAILASVVAVVAGQGSAGAASNKPFAVNLCAAPTGTPMMGQYCSLGGTAPVIAPGSASGGVGSTAASLEADFTDETTKGAGLTIGSINLTAPSGVTFGSASFVGGSPIDATCGSSTPATTSCISADGTELELRGLNVAPGATLQVSISQLDTPSLPSPCTTATPCQFSAAAKQSNDYNGPPGNQLNLDSSHSQLGIALESDATCAAANGKKTNSCTNTLADGGADGSLAGTVSITTNATGTSGGDFYESLDYGPKLNDQNQCGAGFTTDHSEYVNGIALEGSNARSLTVTITTTNFGGYQAELCAQTSKTFRAKSQPGNTFTLVSATPTPQLDGSPGFEGLLPDCSTNPQAVSPTVNPKTYPCVLSRSTSSDGNVHTMVVSYPAGFDALRLSN